MLVIFKPVAKKRIIKLYYFLKQNYDLFSNYITAHGQNFKTNLEGEKGIQPYTYLFFKTHNPKNVLP